MCKIFSSSMHMKCITRGKSVLKFYLVKHSHIHVQLHLPKCSWMNPRIIWVNLRMNFVLCFPLRASCLNSIKIFHVSIVNTIKPRRFCIWPALVDGSRANFPNWHSIEPPFEGIYRQSTKKKFSPKYLVNIRLNKCIVCVCVCDFVSCCLFVFK